MLATTAAPGGVCARAVGIRSVGKRLVAGLGVQRCRAACGRWRKAGTVVAVLSDKQIRDQIRIEPFEKAVKRPGKVSYGVSSYGYDIRVGSHFKIFTPTPRHGGIAVVDPKNFSDDLFVEVDCSKLGTD